MEIVKLEYSETFVKKAIRSYWWKQVGPLYLTVTISLFIFLVYLLLKGDRSWLVGLLSTVVLLSIIVITASYFVHLRRALASLRRMKKPETTLELSENRLRISSDVGDSAFEWSIITQAWRFNEAWLLFFSAGEFMTLPTKNIPELHKNFIISKLKEHGLNSSSKCNT